MKVFLAKVYCFRKLNNVDIESLREFIVSGEDEFHAKDKMEHLLKDFAYNSMKVVEICTPYEIF